MGAYSKQIMDRIASYGHSLDHTAAGYTCIHCLRWYPPAEWAQWCQLCVREVPSALEQERVGSHADLAASHTAEQAAEATVGFPQTSLMGPSLLTTFLWAPTAEEGTTLTTASTQGTRLMMSTVTTWEPAMMVCKSFYNKQMED